MSHTTFSHQRLIAILGMLGSEHDGERAAAAMQAFKMVRDAGLTWDRIIQAPIGAYAGAPDFPILWNGRLLEPPHEGRWLATALFLFRQAVAGTHRITQADAEWLTRRVPIWRQKPLRPDEAARLVAIYDAVMKGPR